MLGTAKLPLAATCSACETRLSSVDIRSIPFHASRRSAPLRKGDVGVAKHSPFPSRTTRRTGGCAATAACEAPQLLSVDESSLRHAFLDEELKACAKLRAETFYTYPPERAFAGQLHQIIKAKEEFAALRQQRDTRAAREPAERSACLMAACPRTCLHGQPASAFELEEIGSELLLGTLDLYAVRAMPGEVLIGECSAPAYLANVCVARAAHRQGIGKRLLDDARRLADEWGCEALFVHILWVNTKARQFYESQGFYIDMEESANTAHYRGHCLEGIEGRGRTILLRSDFVERKQKPAKHRII